MFNWDRERIPERKWVIRNRVPLKQAGLFSGEGGTGKNIIEPTKTLPTSWEKIGLARCRAGPGPAFYVGAEDDEYELHIHLAAIAKRYAADELIRRVTELRVLTRAGAKEKGPAEGAPLK